MTVPKGSAAERAGRAAKAAWRRRKKRGRVVEWTVGAMVGVPLLFAAVWVRIEMSESLRARDRLLAERDRLERTMLELEAKRARLSTWDSIVAKAGRLGLRPPAVDEVLWVPVPESAGPGA